jgi:hypothetical protein
MITCSNVRNPISEPIERAHVFILHGGEFLQFVLSVVNVDLEHIVGLFLNFFFPLVPIQK